MSSRIESLRSLLGDERPPVALITDPINMRYLTGFTGDVGLLLITADATVLAVDPRYTEQARGEASSTEVTEVRGRWPEALATQVERLGISSLAFEADHVTVRQLEDWRKAVPGVDLAPETGLVAGLRVVKDAGEIALIERAVALTDEAFAAARDWLRPGKTESEAAWFIESYMRTHGAESVAFDPIVAAGPNGAMAHAHPGPRPIAAGEPIVIDIGARISGYNGDLTRTLCAGPAVDRFQEIYNLVLSAQLAAEAAIGPGMSGKDADGVARKVIADAGYADAFGHGLGHGVGLQIHEGPRLSTLSGDTLEPGYIVTIEPGIYIPGWGGVRIEDMAVITDDGCRILTRSSKEYWVNS